MKTIVKKICVVFMLFFSTVAVDLLFANSEAPDTIRMEMPNGVAVEYAMSYHRNKLYRPYYSKLNFFQKVLPKSLGDFLKKWEVLGITNLEERKPLFIVNLANKIQITERKENTTVLFPKDAKVALVMNGKHKLKLPRNHYNVFIYFDNIQQLKELEGYDYQKIFANSDKRLAKASADKKNKRRSLEAWLSVNKDSAVELTYQKFIPKPYRQDYINLNFSPNIENINGSWLSGIEPNIGVVFNDKWRLNFGYEFKYNFSDTHTTNISHWGNFRAMAKSEFISDGWVGLSFGYLFKERGDFFDNHKFRFGIPVTYDNFTVTPEFYFKDFFKSSKKENKYFGVKISFGL